MEKRNLKWIGIFDNVNLKLKGWMVIVMWNTQKHLIHKNITVMFSRKHWNMFHMIDDTHSPDGYLIK